MEKNNRLRAQRRHHYQRLKAKRQRQNYWGYEWCDTARKWDARSLGMCVESPAPCSGMCCGNQRPWFGETLAERRVDDSFHAQWRDLTQV